MASQKSAAEAETESVKLEAAKAVAEVEKKKAEVRKELEAYKSSIPAKDLAAIPEAEIQNGEGPVLEAELKCARRVTERGV